MDTSIFIPTRVANQHKVADWQQGEDVTDFMLISTWINDITIPLVVSMIHMYHPAIYFGCVATKLIATCQSFDTLLMYIHRKMCTYVWHHLWKYAYKKKEKRYIVSYFTESTKEKHNGSFITMIHHQKLRSVFSIHTKHTVPCKNSSVNLFATDLGGITPLV